MMQSLLEKHSAPWAYMSPYSKVMSMHVSSCILFSLWFIESLYIYTHIYNYKLQLVQDEAMTSPNEALTISELL